MGRNPALHPLPNLPRPACSASSPSSDEMLSFISSYLNTHPHSALHSGSAALASGGTSQSSGSGAIELRTDARLWEVQWPELTILRLVGRGSFGAVYLADWNRTRVAVKVLVSKGRPHIASVAVPPIAVCSTPLPDAQRLRWGTTTCQRALPATENIDRGELHLPERVMRELHAEAAVMTRMRHPK